MQVSAHALLVLAGLVFAVPGASAVVAIDWTWVGDPGNACDSQVDGCYGAVGYPYRIGTYEVTNAQYTEFLNAKAASDPLGLYNTSMGTTGGITRTGSSGSYSYSTIAGREDWPVNHHSIYDEFRFVNWLNNGQGSGDTETGAYALLGGTAVPSNGLFITRSQEAMIFLPSESEWYKAAYFDGAAYFDYPAGSDTQTTCATPTATPNSANCNNVVGDLTITGSYTGSASPYGTFDQGGNVFERTETISSGGMRVFRGGWRGSGPEDLAAAARADGGMTNENQSFGFRVAALPVVIDWTPVGNPGNAADITGYGAVGNAYKIGTYEVTNAEYAEFLDAKAAADPLGLYNALMGTDGDGGIARTGSSGSYSYSAITGREDWPVTFMTFYDVLRFVNWLHNGQGNGDTETGAYTLLGGTATPTNGSTVTRNAGARIALTSEDEWYKAAYFDGTSYFDYPAGSDTQTTCATPTATANSANCNNAVGDPTSKGSYTGSPSPYGTFDQGGNALEWNESITGDGFRATRGGAFVGGGPGNPVQMAASNRMSLDVTVVERRYTGFRVVPEPGRIPSLIGAIAMLGLLARRRA